MQPRLRQVPPRRSFSMRVTCAPSWAARIAATYPPGPPPITATSVSMATVKSFPRTFAGQPLDEEMVRAFEQLPNSAEKLGGRCAIDDPVVEGQAQPHRRASYQLSLANDRSFDNPSNAQNCGFG